MGSRSVMAVAQSIFLALGRLCARSHGIIRCRVSCTKASCAKKTVHGVHKPNNSQWEQKEASEKRIEGIKISTCARGARVRIIFCVEPAGPHKPNPEPAGGASI